MSALLTLLGDSRFSPGDLSGLAVWLNSKTFLTDGVSSKDGSDLVATWRNLGSAGSATQSTTVSKPKFVASAANGFPGIQGRHDGANASQLVINDSAALDYTTFSAFTVATRVADLGAVEVLAGKHTSTGNLREWYMGLSSGDLVLADISADGITDVNTTISGSVSLNTPLIVDMQFDGATASISKNNGTPATISSAGVFNGSSPYTLFTRRTLTSPFAGYIHEHIFVAPILTAAKRLQVLRYLSEEWRIALS